MLSFSALEKLVSRSTKASENPKLGGGKEIASISWYSKSSIQIIWIQKVG